MQVDIPCKIGDVAWGIRRYKGVPRAQKGFINEMFFTKDMKLMIVLNYICRGEWDKKVFSTEAECKAAIAAMK